MNKFENTSVVFEAVLVRGSIILIPFGFIFLYSVSSIFPTMSGEGARSFVIWLHGPGPTNEPLQTIFASPEFNNTVWSFPTALSNPVTCNNGRAMPSWFDTHKTRVTEVSSVVSRASQVLKFCNWGCLIVHGMIDEEVARGADPRNIFVWGFSQGGALTLASVLLYPKTLGGAAVFSEWVPANASLLKRVTPEARKACPGLRHVVLNEELMYLENWMKPRLPSP
uniref:Phospholipase/carboxylesterase/thioesterase domain-containing protein n=1 Tax=Kalanchoe fedtschenkoi TaxID=63787 RepID=A0A7N1A096_KALFE